MRALKSVITGFLLFSVMPLFAQSNYDKETFEDAEYFFMQEDYQESLASYLRLYKKGYKENANINYRLGICYLNSNTEKEKAVAYLEFAVKKLTSKYREGELKEENAPFDALLFLGNAYRINMQHDKAIESYNNFLEVTKDLKNLNLERSWATTQIEACKRAKVATNNLVRVKYWPMGKPINNSSTNNYPAISANEDFIAYISKQRFYSAVMFSKKKKDKWETPRNITPEIQSDGDMVPVYVSPDGKTLLLAKFESENGDIYISQSNGREWSVAKPISKEINTKYWESHACMTADGKTIYFTSNKPQSLGGTDIFCSKLQADGKWGQAVNLGDVINTRLNEETPYITPDGKTLYFSSQSHETIGGFDIFYSNLDENGIWSKPVNLGYPVNTTDDDLFYVPTANKYYAYQAKAFKSGMGDLDIYQVETFSDEHPYTFNIRGNILQLLRFEDPAKYTVSLIDYNSKKEIETTKPASNGDFSFTKIAGTYFVKLKSDSFTINGKYFIVPENYPSENYNLNPEIMGVSEAYDEYLALRRTGKKFVEKSTTYEKGQRPALIHNILFSFAESRLTKDAENELDTIAKLMLEVPSLEVEIVGYTDGVGGEEYNQVLSEKRAASVKKRLTDKNVNAQRVISSGKGEANPIAINENPDGSDNPIGRAFNRRVEFKILKSENKNIRVETIKVPDELKP